MFITSGLLVFCHISVFSDGCSYTDIIFQDQWQNSGTNHKLEDFLWTYSLIKDKRTSIVVPLLAMKSHRGSRSIAPLILYLATGWRWPLIPTSWPLYPRSERLSWPLSRFEDFGKEINFLFLPGYKTGTVHSVSVLTTLSRLSYII